MIGMCVLRSGGKYLPEHAQRLADQVRGLGLWCLSDLDIPRVPTMRLLHNWPGWWSKLELCRPDIKGDQLYIDLDSEIVGDLNKLIIIGHNSGRSLMWDDPIRPEHANSSVMWLREADRAVVWHAFMKDPLQNMRDYRTWPDRWGDQGFYAAHLPNVGRWPKGLIRSWRLECQDGIPTNTVIVSFHGKPKPWETAAERRWAVGP